MFMVGHPGQIGNLVMSFPEPKLPLSCGTGNENDSCVVSPDIYWYETIYGKSVHKRTNQRSNHYMLRGVTGNTTYLSDENFPFHRPMGSGNEIDKTWDEGRILVPSATSLKMF